MLHTLRTAFRKFRAVMRPFRAALYGVALVLTGWIFIAPPSATEITTLGLAQDATVENEHLRRHRMAKVLVMVGTDRTYKLIASRVGDDLTADDIRLSVQITANGRPSEVNITNTAAQATPSGAKFVAARTN